jgi:MGT family glycosyltransferase
MPPAWTTHAPRSDGSMPLRARVAWARRTFGNFQDVVAPIFGLGQRQIARRLVGPKAAIRTFGRLRAELPRVVACPVEFEFPGRRPERWSYVDALVDLDRSAAPFDWSVVPPGRDVVYVAMGTQTWLIRGRDRLFATFFEAASMMPDVHMVLVAGDARASLGQAPPNVTVLEHAPQLAILSRATVMVTHAGLNSVKESISMGVPMVALPVARDQPGNAARIAYHGLGVHLDYRRLTPTGLRAAIDLVRKTPTYRHATRRMQAHFEARRRRNEIVDVIERHLARSSR